MGLRRYGNQRDANEPEIIAALEKVGASVYPLDLPMDLLVGYRGKTYLIEVKSEKGKFTKDQAQFVSIWRGQYAVVRCIDDALRAIGVLPDEPVKYKGVTIEWSGEQNARNKNNER